MCGFFSIFSKELDINQIKNKFLKSSLKISHRGPDDDGLYIDKDFAIKCFRLSIMDLSDKGHQPMISDDKNLILGFNGEIYNHQYLKKELIKKGYNFKGDSDTEVLLNSYIEWGNNCVKYLRGMFAFIIWNKLRKHIRS